MTAREKPMQAVEDLSEAEAADVLEMIATPPFRRRPPRRSSIALRSTMSRARARRYAEADVAR
jgi:hypothetical protein